MKILRELIETFQTNADAKKIPQTSGIYQITDDTHMVALTKGRLVQHKGWTHINSRQAIGEKTYIGFVNLQGQCVTITNLTEFCRNNNLHPVHMFQLINGQRKSHKGWTWRLDNNDK